VSLQTLREKIDQLKELMAKRGRDFSRLSISMLGSPDELKQKPGLLSRLGELGVEEMVLFFSGMDAQGTVSQLEDFARTMMQ